jgi:hypothetical protein
VCKELVNIICIKSSVKYLHHVMKIMDPINALGHSVGQPFDAVRDQLIAQMLATIEAKRPEATFIRLCSMSGTARSVLNTVHSKSNTT